MISMKHFQIFTMCLVGGLLLSGAATNAKADEWNKKTFITTSQAIEVPGAVLPPGKYVFKLLDSPSDRHIVQVLNARESKIFSTSLTIPRQRMDPTDRTVLTFFEVKAGQPEPVRTWFYPGDLIEQEFVYPKSRMEQFMARGGQSTITIAKTRPIEQPQAEPTPAPAPEPEPQVETPSPAPPEEPTPAPPPEAPAPPMPHTAGNTVEIGILGLMCLGLAVMFRIVNARQGSKS
jgi:hypothetical protein